MAAHNFKKTVLGSGKYISKAPRAHDSNPGTDAAAPKASLSQQGTTAVDKNIIGSCIMREASLTGPNTASTRYTLEADGLTIIDLLGSGAVQNRHDLIGPNFIIKNGVWQAPNGNPGAQAYSRTDIVFDTITGTASCNTAPNAASLYDWIRCKFINCEVLAAVSGSRFKNVFRNCIIASGSSSKVYQGQFFVNGYTGQDVIIQMQFAAAGPVPSITDVLNTANNHLANCNINGVIRLPISGGLWKDYAVQDQYVGTPQANGYAVGVNWLNEANLTADGFIGTVSGWNTLVATLMNRDPKFLDAANGNFLLASDSPHIGNAFGGSGNIGGTDVGILILNSDHGIGGVSVLASPEIDTTVPTNYFVAVGETEGYVDYVARIDAPILRLDILDAFTFDVAFAGGTPQNSHVPDSQPLNATYAKLSSTIASGSTTQFILDNSKVIAIGEWASILGESREVTNVEANTPVAGQKRVTVASAFRATIGSGVEVTYGTEIQIAGLNPNRLTYGTRTRSTDTPPTIPLADSDWDNEIDPGYGYVGTFFHQEHATRPGLVNSGGIWWGLGDSDAPTGLSPQYLNPKWMNVRVYKRQNMNNKGLPA